MADVRFRIKGQEQETVFSPIMGEGGKLYLYAKLSDNEEKKIPLMQDPDTKVFKLTDVSMFEEAPEVIDERLLGLSGEWMDEQEEYHNDRSCSTASGSVARARIQSGCGHCKGAGG